MRIKILWVIISCLVVSASSIFGQDAQDPDKQRKEQQEAYDRQNELLDRAARASGKYPSQLSSPSEIRLNRSSQNRPTIPAKEIKRIKELRMPSAEDLEKYRIFLKDSKTGIFRLFPYVDCNFKNIVYTSGDCARTVPFSWSYSFRQKDYGNENFFDLRLNEQNISADSFLTQEILVSLNDVELPELSLQSKGLKFLADFAPATQSREVKKQFAEIAGIIEADGYRYGKVAKIELNKTYALRSIAYRVNDKVTANLTVRTASAKDLDKLEGVKDDKRTDVIIAFRVIRQETDGSLTILWKELQRQEAPEIIFPKNEKLTDIK